MIVDCLSSLRAILGPSKTRFKLLNSYIVDSYKAVFLLLCFFLFAFLVFDEVPFHIIQPLPDGLEELSSVTIEFMSCVSAK